MTTTMATNEYILSSARHEKPTKWAIAPAQRREKIIIFHIAHSTKDEIQNVTVESATSNTKYRNSCECDALLFFNIPL